MIKVESIPGLYKTASQAIHLIVKRDDGSARPAEEVDFILNLLLQCYAEPAEPDTAEEGETTEAAETEVYICEVAKCVTNSNGRCQRASIGIGPDGVCSKREIIRM